MGCLAPPTTNTTRHRWCTVAPCSARRCLACRGGYHCGWSRGWWVVVWRALAVGFADLPRFTHGGYDDVTLTFVRALMDWGDRGWGDSGRGEWCVKRRIAFDIVVAFWPHRHAWTPPTRTHIAIATWTGVPENGQQPSSTTTEDTDHARIDRWKADTTENAAYAHVNT